MKKIILIFLSIILLSSIVFSGTYRPPLSQTADWLGSKPSPLEVGKSVNIGDRKITLINTGDDGLNYIILDVNGFKDKIYEKGTETIESVEIYVDSISDKPGNEYDSAIIYLALRDSKLLGSRGGENAYEVKKGDSWVLKTNEKLVLEDVKNNYVILNVDGFSDIIYLDQRKIIKNLNIKLKKTYYNSATDGGSATLTLYREEQYKKELPKKPEQKIEQVLQCPDGCLYQNSCVGIGFFTNDIYCSENKLIVLKKKQNEECSFSYECNSESCNEGICDEIIIEDITVNDIRKPKLSGWFLKLKEWLFNWFDGRAI